MLLIDAANVIGSRPDGWWKDRAGAARRLVTAIRSAVAEGRLPTPVVVVLEGAARGGVEEGDVDGVRIRHAPGSGDDEMARVALAGAASEESMVAVTADRALRHRLEGAGASVVGPSWMWDQVGARREIGG